MSSDLSRLSPHVSKWEELVCKGLKSLAHLRISLFPAIPCCLWFCRSRSASQQVENSPQSSRNGPLTRQGTPAGIATPHCTPAGHLWVSQLGRAGRRRVTVGPQGCAVPGPAEAVVSRRSCVSSAQRSKDR